MGTEIFKLRRVLYGFRVRNWAIVVLVSAGSLLWFGISAAIMENPLFAWMTPVMLQDYVVGSVTAVLSAISLFCCWWVFSKRWRFLLRSNFYLGVGLVVLLTWTLRLQVNALSDFNSRAALLDR